MSFTRATARVYTACSGTLTTGPTSGGSGVRSTWLRSTLAPGRSVSESWHSRLYRGSNSTTVPGRARQASADEVGSTLASLGSNSPDTP